ncbi:hypothetical protein HU200_013930 [Digitaria exilis]|uniref:Zinc finger GRF-type domain-containing protein n=1 Tax=Digitaria exilis TaxID=1010633 RepID=A0A835KJ93_9POAL|nr:hypothetical protein HU200_013930 [Digitaria exilis]
MSTWRDDRNAIPPWNERPKCHCGFRTWLQVWDEPLPQGKKGCRFFKCADIDDDFKACTFMQWVDTRPLGAVRPIPEQVENKSQYYARLTQAREEACLAREEHERRVRQQQIRAALKIQEEQFQAREADLKREEEKQKHRYKEAGQSSTTDGRKGKEKFLRFTQ